LTSGDFDRVVLVDGFGMRRSISRGQFLALPLHERIQHILTRDIKFYHGEVPVDRSEALKSLRR